MKGDSGDLEKKILLIDDEADFREVLQKALRKQGFDVQTASHGLEGLRLAAEHLPSLILCDLVMPGMSGYEVLTTLRTDEKLAAIPVIFLTAQAEPAEVRQGMNLGADDYLIKPASLPELLNSINARLRRRHSERLRHEKQMDRAMRLFAEMLHDIRNPLFAVFGYTNLLKQAADEPARSQQRSEQIFAAMQQAVTRMQDIISETMFVVRSRMQPMPLNLCVFDLREFCQLLVQDYQSGGRVKFDCSEGCFPVKADATKLRHALENLLSNALKYSEGPVALGLSRIKAEYLLAVSDEGIGIPPEEQVSVFEPFFRASNTAGKPGHGLGLCVVRSCIEEHGGTIQFTSEIDQGCTFSIALPASAPNATDMRPCAQSAESRLNVNRQSDSLPFPPRVVAPVAERVKGRLGDQEKLAPPNRNDISPHSINVKAGERLKTVIVDDDPVVRNLMRELLATHDDILILGEAGTIAHARQLAREHRPAVLFLDINLPDGSGFDMLPDLDPNVSVVFVTSAEDYGAQAFDCAAVDYLVKPVTSERLGKAVQRVRQRLGKKPADCSASNPGLTRSFVVKTLAERRVVKVSEVRSILAYGEYSWVYWEQSKKGALLRKSLKRWESELPAAQFIRVHRRAIINLNFLERIERLSNGRLQLFLYDTPEPIMVSLSQTPMLNRKLKTLRL